MIRVVLFLFVLGCTAAQAAGSPFLVYEEVRNKIITNTLTETDVAKFNNLFVLEDAQKLAALARTAIDEAEVWRHSFSFEKAFVAQTALYRAFLTSQLNWDVYYDYITTNERWQESRIETDRVSPPGLTLSWSYGDHAMGALWAYRASGQKRFLQFILDGLDFALRHRDSDIGKVDEFHNPPIEGWGFDWGEKDPRWETEVTTPGRLFTPAVLLVQEVKNAPERLAEYADEANEIVELAQKYLDPFLPYMTINEGSGYFLNLRKKKHEPFNHQAMYFQALAILYNITGDEKYKIAVNKFMNYFWNHVTLDKETGSYYWPLKADVNIKSSQFWKEGVTISGIAEIATQGFDIKKRDGKRLANTLIRRIVRKFSAVNAYIGPDVYHPWTGYNLSRGTHTSAGRLAMWLRADIWNPQVMKDILSVIVYRRDLFPHGWFGSSAAAAGYVYFIMRKSGE